MAEEGPRGMPKKSAPVLFPAHSCILKTMWFVLVSQMLLSGSRVLALLPISDTLVVVASSAGIHLWRPGGADSLADPGTLSGIPYALAFVPPDTLWVGTDKGLRLCRGKLSRLSCTSIGMDPVRDLLIRGDTLFLATDQGLVLRTPGRELARLNRRVGVPLLSDTLLRLRTAGETLLVATARGLHRVPIQDLTRLNAWTDTLLSGKPVRDVQPFRDTLWIATDSGLYRNGGIQVYAGGAVHALAVAGNTLYAGAWPSGIYRVDGLTLTPLFPALDGHLAGNLVFLPDGVLWGDDGGWPGLFPEEGGGLWKDTLPVSKGLPFRRATDLVEDRDGHLWGIFWNREALPLTPSGAIWVYLPEADTILWTTLPQPYALAPHPEGGVWVAHYVWGGRGNAGAYRVRVVGTTLQVDSVDLGSRFVMTLEPYGSRLFFGYYQGGSSGRFGIRVREEDGSLRTLQDNLLEIWRVEQPAVLRVCAGRLWVGTHNLGLLVLDLSGSVLGSITRGHGLPGDGVVGAVCAGDSLLVLSDGGLASVYPDLTVRKTLPLPKPVTLTRGLGAIWVLTTSELLKLDEDFTVKERIPLGSTRIPGELFASTDLRTFHRPLAVLSRSARVAVATTRGVVLLSFAGSGGISPWVIWPHPVRGREFFLEGPPAEQFFLLSPQGKRIPLQVDRMGGGRLRVTLLLPPSRGPHWLVIEAQGQRHTRLVLFSP